MKYQRMAPGIFLDRPNRFIAHVQIDGKEETVHVEKYRPLPGTAAAGSAGHAAAVGQPESARPPGI